MPLSLASRIADFLYPPYCTVCLAVLPSDLNGASYLSAPFCNNCMPSELYAAASPGQRQGAGRTNLKEAQDTRAYCRQCGAAACSLCPGSDICIVCAAFPAPVRQLRSALVYAGAAKRAICAFKYRAQRSMAPYFGRLLAQTLAGNLPDHPAFVEPRWDVVLAVPSSTDTLRGRGFNHVGLAARNFCRITGLKLDLLALRSSRIRKPQAGVPLNERTRNVQNAFQARTRLKNLSVLLLDDVITSGATVWAATNAVLTAGALSVDVLTIARSPRFSINRISAQTINHG